MIISVYNLHLLIISTHYIDENSNKWRYIMYKLYSLKLLYFDHYNFSFLKMMYIAFSHFANLKNL